MKTFVKVAEAINAVQWNRGVNDNEIAQYVRTRFCPLNHEYAFLVSAHGINRPRKDAYVVKVNSYGLILDTLSTVMDGDWFMMVDDNLTVVAKDYFAEQYIDKDKLDKLPAKEVRKASVTPS